VGGLLKGYYRDLQQSQPNHIEIVAEKITLENVIAPVAMDYTIPYSIGRGDSDIGTRRRIARRFLQGGKEWLVLLLLGDFDPDGEKIVHAFARSLRDDFGIEKLKPIKVALTRDQVKAFGLHDDIEAKKTSSSYKEFFRKYQCAHAYELEALRPRQLQDLLRKAIDDILDVEAFNAELTNEKEDAAQLETVRRQVHAALRGVKGIPGGGA
jgi:hypothetical protein